MKGREWIISIVAFVIAISIGVLAYWQKEYWQALLINLSTTFLGLGAALAVINVYLDLNSRKGAIKPLLNLVVPNIREQHNALLDQAWGKFGKPQFKDLVKRFMDNKGDPRALTPVERDTLYEMIKADKDAIFSRMDKVESDLKELALLLGWSFKPGILRASFRCRFGIDSLRKVEFNDSDQSKLMACKHFLDIDITATSVFRQLIDFLNIKKSDVYDPRA